MSLVSAFIGNVKFGHLASIREDDIVDIQEEIDAVAEKMKDYGPILESASTDIKHAERKLDSLDMMSYRATNQREFAYLQYQRKQIILDVYRKEQSKIILEIEKNKLARRERRLQAELKAAELQLQLAKQFQETDQKMQQGAIKRFAINI